MLVQFENINLEVREEPTHGWLLETALVAECYQVEKQVIKKHLQRNASEFIEGKHFVRWVQNVPSNEPQIFFTKRGVIRLGFFIKSERAKKFRDFAEDLIVNKPIPKTQIELIIESAIELQQHELRLSNIEVRLNQMEETKQLAIAELSYIERSTKEVPEIGLRLKINQIVRAYVEKTNISYSNIWSSMYSKMLYAYRFNVNGYKKRHKNESNMDIIERENQLDNLFALVSRELV
jgi:hypothetical protein